MEELNINAVYGMINDLINRIPNVEEFFKNNIEDTENDKTILRTDKGHRLLLRFLKETKDSKYQPFRNEAILLGNQLIVSGNIDRYRTPKGKHPKKDDSKEKVKKFIETNYPDLKHEDVKQWWNTNDNDSRKQWNERNYLFIIIQYLKKFETCQERLGKLEEMLLLIKRFRIVTQSDAENFIQLHPSVDFETALKWHQTSKDSCGMNFDNRVLEPHSKGHNYMKYHILLEYHSKVKETDGANMLFYQYTKGRNDVKIKNSPIKISESENQEVTDSTFLKNAPDFPTFEKLQEWDTQDRAQRRLTARDISKFKNSDYEMLRLKLKYLAIVNKNEEAQLRHDKLVANRAKITKKTKQNLKLKATKNIQKN